MTQEEQLKIQSKAYTELINRLEDVKNAIKKQNYGIAMDVLCKPYPQFQVITHSELKESEDERIRKELLEHCRKRAEMYNTLLTAKEYSKVQSWLAWLEKQGKNDMGISEATKKELEDKLHKALEKETAESFNKFLDEQKPADKVEPKFHEGEWIVYNDNLYRIGNIALQRYYECLRVDGTVHTFSLDIDSKSHLWTIQDAKAGDVLAVEEIEEKYQYPFVAIYKERGLDFFNSYCSIGFDGKFYEGNTGHSTKKIHPATKEQRNLLFQKMKEAGYEWDAEKKELKKIEQKPTEDVDLPEFESYLCLMFQKFRTKGMCTNGEIIDYVKEHSQKLRDILVKPAWGEEDEKQLNDIISLLPGLDIRHNWLKSLKDRVQQQSKQEWNEDTQQWIDAIIKDYEGRYDADKDHRATIQVKINILKSLKDKVQSQNKWKESLATADLENSLCHIQSGFPDTSYEYRILGEAIEFIRCTEPKSQWTPSEGQMELLREVQQALLGKDCHNRFVNFMYELKRLREE